MVNVRKGSSHSATGVTVMIHTMSEEVEVDGQNEFRKGRWTLLKDVTVYVLFAPFLNVSVCGLLRTFSESSCLSRRRMKKPSKPGHGVNSRQHP